MAALEATPPWRLTLTLAVVVQDLTVMDSPETNRVVLPAASFGVAVTVAVSPAPIVVAVEDSEIDAGAPATVQSTQALKESPSGPAFATLPALPSRSAQIRYLIVAAVAGTEAAASLNTDVVDEESV